MLYCSQPWNQAQECKCNPIVDNRVAWPDVLQDVGSAVTVRTRHGVQCLHPLPGPSTVACH